jgi:glycosyltransferase involved in cell wall biosynthesis
MRIGIDARELCGKPTGVGRYLRALLDRWSASGALDRHAFVLYLHQAPATEIPASLSVRLVPGGGGTLWEQFRLAPAANRDRLDVVLAPGYTAAVGLRMPFVVTIHDLSFVAHPEWFTAREGTRRRCLTRWAARHAHVVLTVSDFSRTEIVSRFGVPAERVQVVRHGLTPPPRPAAPQPRREPMVLFAGSIFNRRRLPDLIRAFGTLARRLPDVRLEIVGEDRTHPRQDLAALVLSEGLEGRVSIRSYVSDAALADLYERARCLAFLSEYEGFGLTPLEALARGVPVVLLDTPVARETCGDAALYVNRDEGPGTASALESAMFDEELRSRLLDRAGRVLERYSWDTAAHQTLGALERAAGHGRD